MNKIKRGTGFRPLLEYLFANKDGPAPGRLIGGTMASSNPRDLAAEFKASRRLRPDVEKPVWHNALRMPAGEDVSDSKWREITRDYLSAMGFDLQKTQYCLVKHDDEGAVHICASRIQMDGSLYLGKNENLASTRIIQQLEKQHGLTVTKGPDLTPDGRILIPEKSRIKKNELDAAVRTKAVPPRERLKTMVGETLVDRPSLLEFKRRLESAGVVVQANLASTGRMNGFSFELDGVPFKASQLGDQFKWQNLKEKLNYDEARDAHQLEGLRTQPLTGPAELASANIRAAGRNLQAARRAAGNLDRAARNITHRSTLRAVAAAAAAYQHQADRNREAIIECAEADLSRRQAYKRQLFEERYNARVSAALLSRLQYVQRGVTSTTLKLHGGGVVVDRGDTMSTRSQATREEAKALIELAQIKGWQTLKVEGSSEFKQQVAEEAFKTGLKVEGYQLSAERQQALQIELERERVQRARNEFSSPTPRPR